MLTEKRKLEILDEISDEIMQFAAENNSEAVITLTKLNHCLISKGYKTQYGNLVEDEMRSLFGDNFPYYSEIFGETSDNKFYKNLMEAEDDSDGYFNYIYRAKYTMIEFCKRNGGSIDIDMKSIVGVGDEVTENIYALLDYGSGWKFEKIELKPDIDDIWIVGQNFNDGRKIKFDFEELNYDYNIIYDILYYLFEEQNNVKIN